MSNGMQIEVIAEGIETSGQLAFPQRKALRLRAGLSFF